MHFLVETLVRLLGLTQMKRLLVLQNIFYMGHGHVRAEVVCCQLPTAAAWIRSQARSCEILGGRSGTEAGFLRVLRFPLPILIHRLIHAPRGLVQIVADVPSGLFHPTPINKKTMKNKHMGQYTYVGLCLTRGLNCANASYGHPSYAWVIWG
jgi:hypothetical protein